MAAIGFTADSLWLTRIALGAPLVLAAAQTLRPGLRGDFKMNRPGFSNVSWSLEGCYHVGFFQEFVLSSFVAEAQGEPKTM